MPALTILYCGVFWYRLIACDQSASLSGGRAPVTGAHITIDNPDSVRRVMAPTSAITKTAAAQVKIQKETFLEACIFLKGHEHAKRYDDQYYRKNAAQSISRRVMRDIYADRRQH